MNTFTYLLGRPFPISFPQPLPHISSRQDAPAESTGGKQAFRNMAKMQQKLSECGLRAETNYNSRDFLRTKNRGSHRAATAGFPRTKGRATTATPDVGLLTCASGKAPSCLLRFPQ